MKKRYFIILAILVCSCVFACTVCQADVTAVAEDNPSETYQMYEAFCTLYPDRTSGTPKEREAANWIASALLSVKTRGIPCFVGENGEASVSAYNKYFSSPVAYTNENGDESTTSIDSQNVVAYKRCGIQDAKLLVLSTGYSNSYSIINQTTNAPTKNEGAYEVSGGVASLLSIAYKIKDLQLDFDVALLFYGANSYGYIGVENFYNSNQQTVLGNIDLCAVTGGDDLYVYYDEVSTKHGELLDSKTERFGYNIKSAPFDKKYFTMENSYLPYAHSGLYGTASYCLQKEIALVELFGFSWDSLGNRESTRFDNVLGTASDTYSYMDKNYGSEFIDARLNLVCDFVVNALSSNTELVDAMGQYKNSYEPLINDAAYYGFTFSALALLVALVILGIVLTSKRTKSVGKPNFAADSQFFTGEKQSTDNDDDIFGMPTDTVEGDSKDIDSEDDLTSEDKKPNDDDDNDDIFGEL